MYSSSLTLHNSEFESEVVLFGYYIHIKAHLNYHKRIIYHK